MHRCHPVYPDSLLCMLFPQDLSRNSSVQVPVFETAKVTTGEGEEEGKEKRPEYPKPDLTQMLPFKPRQVIRK